MTKKELLQQIRQKFDSGLREKTGWGRNEVIALYDNCVRETLIESLDD